MKRYAGLLALLLLLHPVAASAINPQPEPPEGYGKTQGIIPGIPLIFGPKLSVAIPHPSIGLEVKFANLVGASFDYGFFPDVTVSNVTIGFTSGWHLDGRLYPFRGAFFLGASLGGRSFRGSYTGTVLGVPIKGTTTLDATYLAPEIGWRWVWESGLFLGVELGWEFLLSQTRTDSPEVIVLRAQGQTGDLDRYVNDYGNAGLPHVALLSVGWFF